MSLHIIAPADLSDWLVQRTYALENELSSRLGRALRIVYTDSLIGAVRAPKSRQAKTRLILMNPAILKSQRQSSSAVKAWRGVGYHEVGHIENPCWEEYRQARDEGFQFFMNVIDDEQNERRMGRKEFALRELFAHAAKWILARNRKNRKENRESRYSYVNMANDFLYHFRRNHLSPWTLRFLHPYINSFLKKVLVWFSLTPWPVKLAVAKMPLHLPDISKPEVFELARMVHHLLLKHANAGSYNPSQLDDSDCLDSGTSTGASDERSGGEGGGGSTGTGNGEAQPKENNEAGGKNGESAKKSGTDPGRGWLDFELPDLPNETALCDELGFDPILNVKLVEPDEDIAASLLSDVIPAAQSMRRYLGECGWFDLEQDDQEAGHSVGDDVERYFFGDNDIFVDDEIAIGAHVDLQVIIDCSGSMLARGGGRFRLAKSFGMLVEEATVDLRGVSAHLWGFTDKVLLDCGVPGELRVSGLESRSNFGNNDSAALFHAAQESAKSGKSIKILLMISDGQPTECSWQSLHDLVNHLEASGYICVQVAVNTIEKPAFERFFIDLSEFDMDEAVVEFGQLLLSLITNGVPH